jgi:hypothetical protein
VPNWISELVSSRPLRLQGNANYQPPVWDMAIDDGRIGTIETRGRWRAGDGAAANALFLLQHGSFAAGLELAGGSVDVRLVGAEKWFDSKLDEFAGMSDRSG